MQPALLGGGTIIGQKILPLRECIDVFFGKTDMVIHRKDDTGGGDIDSDDLDKPFQTCEIQGNIAIPTFPKYR